MGSTSKDSLSDLGWCYASRSQTFAAVLIVFLLLFVWRKSRPFASGVLLVWFHFHDLYSLAFRFVAPTWRMIRSLFRLLYGGVRRAVVEHVIFVDSGYWSAIKVEASQTSSSTA